MGMAAKSDSYKTIHSFLSELTKTQTVSNDSQQGPPDVGQTLLAPCSAAHHAGPSASANCQAHSERPVTQTYESHNVVTACHGVTDSSNKGSRKLCLIWGLGCFGLNLAALSKSFKLGCELQAGIGSYIGMHLSEYHAVEQH